MFAAPSTSSSLRASSPPSWAPRCGSLALPSTSTAPSSSCRTRCATSCCSPSRSCRSSSPTMSIARPTASPGIRSSRSRSCSPASSPASFRCWPCCRPARMARSPGCWRSSPSCSYVSAFGGLLCRLLGLHRLERQHRHRLDLEQRPGPREAGYRERSRSRQRPGVEIAYAHLAQHRQVSDIGEIAIELHNVGKGRVHRSERGFEILEHLHGLRPEVADHIAVEVDAKLAGNVDGAAGAHDLDHMRVARRLGERLRIDEPNICHGVSPWISAFEFGRYLDALVCIQQPAHSARQITGDFL